MAIKQKYDLERFKKKHEEDFEDALAEIQTGYKMSHWMWYILPQIKGLGCSGLANYYAIEDIDEAKAYLKDPILSDHMEKMCAALLQTVSDDPELVMGYPDDLKLRSCMTLFQQADPDNGIYQKVLDKFFDGEPDKNTLELLKHEVH